MEPWLFNVSYFLIERKYYNISLHVEKIMIFSLCSKIDSHSWILKMDLDEKKRKKIKKILQSKIEWFEINFEDDVSLDTIEIIKKMI